MSEISTQPYKGTRDSYPEDMNVQRYIFDTWSKVARIFGYEEYDTPLIEEVQLYKEKSGDEIANKQLYNFTDKGGREIAIRPEMTPSLARMIAARKNEMTLPLRFFNIGKYYRYEKPQKGRTREFIQLNIDIFGVPTIDAEIEILQYTLRVMDEFKAPKETYEIKINNRYLLDYLFEEILSLEEDQKAIVGRAIDNYNKMDEKDFYKYLLEIGLNEDQSEKVKQYLSWTLADLEEIKGECEGASQLIELFKKADLLGLTNLKFEPSIMRGFLYYTGTVIEMFDIGDKENPRAMFGGGRYDDLLEIFGEDKLPAFGLGWGNITMENYLRKYNLIPNVQTYTKVFIPLLDASLYEDVNKLAETLRENGINTEVQLEETKLKKQFKYADKKGFEYVLILGENEVEKGIVQLKNMETGEDEEVELSNIVSRLS